MNATTTDYTPRYFISRQEASQGTYYALCVTQQTGDSVATVRLFANAADAEAALAEITAPTEETQPETQPTEGDETWLALDQVISDFKLTKDAFISGCYNYRISDTFEVTVERESAGRWIIHTTEHEPKDIMCDVAYYTTKSEAAKEAEEFTEFFMECQKEIYLSGEEL